QTAWALMALLSIPTSRYDEFIGAGIEYLLGTQHEGTWHEPQYTGTGFPGYGIGSRPGGEPHERAISIQQGLEVSRGFMINYNLYRHYFPLMALSRARTRIEANENVVPGRSGSSGVQTSIRLQKMHFVESLAGAAPRRKRNRSTIVARRFIRKTAKLLSRRF